MNTKKTKEVALANLHNSWLLSLATYNLHLEQINQLVTKLEMYIKDQYDFKQIKIIQNKINQEKIISKTLILEIKKLKEHFLKRSERNLITVSDLIENNRVRDKVRKTEQTVFMLNNEVNKLNTIVGVRK